MKRIRALGWGCGWLLSLFALTACGGGGGGGGAADTTSDEIVLSLGETTPSFYELDLPTSTADYSFDLTLQAGTSPKDVYLVITNPTENTVSTPLIETAAPASLRAASEALVATAREEGLRLRDVPGLSRLNELPPLAPGVSRALLTPPTAVSLDTVGDTHVFTDYQGTSVNATCRQVVDAGVAGGTRHLNIWVADNSWIGSGCTKANCLDQTMVDAMADAFLKSGSDNDIYDWDTNVFGAEWGPQSFSNLIAADDNITILLYDIDNDNSVTGGVAGLFDPSNNFLASAVPGSNERLMFYMDSNFFGQKSGASWEITDAGPAEMVVVLAHEFQHMINFYQRNVLHSPATSATWLNEMASMAAEDLVATKLGLPGPRGIDAADGSAGTAPIIAGQLPRADYYDYLTLTQWQSGDSGETNVLNSYAQAYAFAAFLNRNYDGANLFHRLLAVPATVSGYDTTGAITYALHQGGDTTLDFADILRRWGIATLLSDDATDAVPAGYRLNRGDFITTSRNGIDYELGSINLYNYRYGSLTGPRIFDSLAASGTPGTYASANTFVRLGSGISGDVTTHLTLRQGTRLSVVVRAGGG